MTPFEKGFLTVLCCDALFALVALPLALRKVPPNVVYGYRTRATLGDERIWYEANAHFGRGLLIAALAGAVVAGLLFLLEPFDARTFLPVSLVVLVLPTLVATIATARRVRTLARDAKSRRGFG